MDRYVRRLFAAVALAEKFQIPQKPKLHGSNRPFGPFGEWKVHSCSATAGASRTATAQAPGGFMIKAPWLEISHLLFAALSQANTLGGRKIFERHFLFRKLSANEIDALIRYARVERYRPGREIFAKGSPGQSLMGVLRGSVKISSLSDSGKEIVFTIFNAGEIFGEIACSMATSEARTRPQ